MAVQLIPPGAGANVQAVLQSFYDALADLQNPDAPTQLASVALKTDLTRYPASDWPNCAILCAEINALCCSTLVTGAWTWLRSDGSAL